MPSSAAELPATTNPSAERPAHHEDTNGDGLLNGMEPNDRPTSLPSPGVRHNTAGRTEPATPQRPRPKQSRIGSTSSAIAAPRRIVKPRPESGVCDNVEQAAYGWDQDQDDEEIKPSALQLSQAAARVVLPGQSESADQNSCSVKRKSTAASDEEEDMDELDDQLREVELKEKKIKIKRKMRKLNKKAA
ncbi:hypothetical protein LTR15_000175 [Elasticomyces elasticus]|nr:hypothetical protein LTR15_000175 [Elasticomyces elasticus]